MISVIKKHHRKAILSVPILFLLLSRGEVPPGNSLYLKPVTYFPETGTPFGIELDFRSTAPVNASDGTIHFPPQYLSVDRIDTSKSVIDLWGATPEWSNGSGAITWSGGIIRPAFTGGKEQGNILRAIFIAKEAVPMQLSIDDATLLASDGTGKNVLANTGNIRIYPRPKGTASPDIDGDRSITARDVAQVVMAMGKKYNPLYDVNGDHVIDFKDVTQMLDYYDALR
jgi:hypothetical protein